MSFRHAILILALAVLPLLPGEVLAQWTPRVSAHLVGGLPQGEFADHLDRTGFGLGFTADIGEARSPFRFGADLGFMIYGWDRSRRPFGPTVPEVDILVETTNSIASGHFFLRLTSPTGTVQPYLDGLFGFRYFWTQSSIKDDHGGQSIASSVNFDDATLSYGLGAGAMIQVFHRSPFNAEGVRVKGPRAVFVNVGLRYLLGAETEYLKDGEVFDEDEVIRADRSRTDMLYPMIGATVQF